MDDSLFSLLDNSRLHPTRVSSTVFRNCLWRDSGVFLAWFWRYSSVILPCFFLFLVPFTFNLQNLQLFSKERQFVAGIIVIIVVMIIIVIVIGIVIISVIIIIIIINIISILIVIIVVINIMVVVVFLITNIILSSSLLLSSITAHGLPEPPSFRTNTFCITQQQRTKFITRSWIGLMGAASNCVRPQVHWHYVT